MNTEKVPQKKVYTTPTLIIYGGVEEITLGSSSGTFLDKDFKAGTLFADLTFSG